VPKEALALAAAMAANRLKNVAVAQHMGVSEGQVSQWVTGRRPVPVDKAVRLAKYVGATPEQISAKYAEYSDSPDMGNVVPLRATKEKEGLRPDLVIARLENDVDALRYAMSALVSAMVIHRPAEAADVAKVVRKHVPAKFVSHGFVAELLRALDKGA